MSKAPGTIPNCQLAGLLKSKVPSVVTAHFRVAITLPPLSGIGFHPGPTPPGGVGPTSGRDWALLDCGSGLEIFSREICARTAIFSGQLGSRIDLLIEPSVAARLLWETFSENSLAIHLYRAVWNLKGLDIEAE